MREQALAAFFRGAVSVRELARDLEGSFKRVGDGGFIVEIEDMQDESAVTSEMAIALCDAVLHGDLPSEALETIGFALLSSDKFFWDGDADDVLANVIPSTCSPLGCSLYCVLGALPRLTDSGGRGVPCLRNRVLTQQYVCVLGKMATEREIRQTLHLAEWHMELRCDVSRKLIATENPIDSIHRTQQPLR